MLGTAALSLAYFCAARGEENSCFATPLAHTRFTSESRLYITGQGRRKEDYMRITNTMITNNTKANINSNKLLVDKYNTQMTTQKKIAKASENPERHNESFLRSIPE